MRDDLLDAQAAACWAETQIPKAQERWLEWQRSQPYAFPNERDPQTGETLVVALEKKPFPLIANAEVGAIINSCRSSLDLLAAALALRNSPKPKSKTYFPITERRRSFLNRLKVIESEGWLSATEIATIKKLQPYRTGDKALWQISKLDNLRKHERLIKASPSVTGSMIFGSLRHFRVGGTRAIERFENKPVLLRLPLGERFNMAYGNTNVAVHIVFGELGVDFGVDEEVATVLYGFTKRCKEVISEFE